MTAATTTGAFIGDRARHSVCPKVDRSDGGKEFVAEFSEKSLAARELSARRATRRACGSTGAPSAQVVLCSSRWPWPWTSSSLHHRQRYNRSGFTPQQRVFDAPAECPGLCSDDLVEVDAMALVAKNDFQRAYDIRALKAHLEPDTRVKRQAAF